MKIVFYGKILGFYYQLDDTNSNKLKTSILQPASTQKEFEKNARKAYSEYKVVFNKVG